MRSQDLTTLTVQVLFFSMRLPLCPPYEVENKQCPVDRTGTQTQESKKRSVSGEDTGQ